mgnify:CR=1 FL=1
MNSFIRKKNRHITVSDFCNKEIIPYENDYIKISKSELKNMTEIINGLLNFSETIQITNKTDINLENFIRKNRSRFR